MLTTNNNPLDLLQNNQVFLTDCIEQANRAHPGLAIHIADLPYIRTVKALAQHVLQSHTSSGYASTSSPIQQQILAEPALIQAVSTLFLWARPLKTSNFTGLDHQGLRLGFFQNPVTRNGEFGIRHTEPRLLDPLLASLPYLKAIAGKSLMFLCRDITGPDSRAVATATQKAYWHVSNNTYQEYKSIWFTTSQPFSVGPGRIRTIDSGTRQVLSEVKAVWSEPGADERTHLSGQGSYLLATRNSQTSLKIPNALVNRNTGDRTNGIAEGLGFLSWTTDAPSRTLMRIKGHFTVLLDATELPPLTQPGAGNALVLSYRLPGTHFAISGRGEVMEHAITPTGRELRCVMKGHWSHESFINTFKVTQIKRRPPNSLDQIRQTVNWHAVNDKGESCLLITQDTEQGNTSKVTSRLQVWLDPQG